MRNPLDTKSVGDGLRLSVLATKNRNTAKRGSCRSKLADLLGDANELVFGMRIGKVANGTLSAWLATVRSERPAFRPVSLHGPTPAAGGAASARLQSKAVISTRQSCAKQEEKWLNQKALPYV